MAFQPNSLVERELQPRASSVCSAGESASAGDALLVASLGLTNGWYSGVGMMCAPKAVAARDAETCGTVMVLFLLAGLATGAACGWLWV